MKVKELIERLQSLGQELDVYSWNEKEHSLFLVEDVHETSDFGENEKGENEWEDFVTIFPSSNTQPLFTLTAEEVEDYREAIKTHIHWLHITKPKTEYWEREKNIYEGYLKRIEEWLDENRTD